MDNLQKLYLESKDPYAAHKDVSVNIRKNINLNKLLIAKLELLYGKELSSAASKMQRHQSDTLDILTNHFDRYVPTMYQRR